MSRFKVGRLAYDTGLSYTALLAVAIGAVLAFCLNACQAIEQDDEPSAQGANLEEQDNMPLLEDRLMDLSESPAEPEELDLFLNLRFEGKSQQMSFIGSASSELVSEDVQEALKADITEIEATGNSVGFVMIDITSGDGIAYNADEEFYSASSIKGVYLAALVYQQPNVLSENFAGIESSLRYSDNDAYYALCLTFLDSCLREWYLEADTEFDDPNFCYPYISARDMARLWLRNYLYFTSGSAEGSELAALYINPNRSTIKQTLGASYITYSKAGWNDATGVLFEGSTYAPSAVDAGIVFAGEEGSYPYVVAIMSDYPASLEKLDSLVAHLDSAHTQLVLSAQSPMLTGED